MILTGFELSSLGAMLNKVDRAGSRSTMLRIEFEREEDGRWIAEIPALPGVMAYGSTREQARGKVEALALRTLADRIDQGEEAPELGELFVAA